MLRNKIASALESMVPTVETCRESAERLRQAYPADTPEQLARRAIRSARRSAAAAGAATGVIANPIVMIPAALADMAVVLRIEGVLAGTLAALFDPASLTEEALRADVVSILFPGAVSQALRQVGIRVGEQMGQRLSAGIIREYLSKDAAKTAMRMATRHLGMELTRKAVLEKTAPLVGRRNRRRLELGGSRRGWRARPALLRQVSRHAKPLSSLGEPSRRVPPDLRGCSPSQTAPRPWNGRLPPFNAPCPAKPDRVSRGSANELR